MNIEPTSMETSSVEASVLASDYRRTRQKTEALCEPLETDDYQIQSILETSPPKWHLAHVTWFFETFVLEPFAPGYRVYHPGFNYLFNSYYLTVGRMHPRPKRGLLSRPTVDEVYRYREWVDEKLLELLDQSENSLPAELAFRITLGLHHEQQHQELLLMDIKHNFWSNPLRPAYASSQQATSGSNEPLPINWLERPGGTFEIGYAGQGFSFDNETPSHAVLIQDHRLAERLVTNGEYLAFIEDGGYNRPELWLSDGWQTTQTQGWQAPLYWEKDGSNWREFTLHGMQDLNESLPVVHLSLFEADAFAQWADKRLPTEAELETWLAELPVEGNFVESGLFHPSAGSGQWFGDAWEWTQSPYSPYPGFKPLEGSIGEYNGKFMCNQMSLRGGCCVSPRDHIRASYRNFFYPHDRWPFTGLRLAEDPS